MSKFSYAGSSVIEEDDSIRFLSELCYEHGDRLLNFVPNSPRIRKKIRRYIRYYLDISEYAPLRPNNVQFENRG